MDPTTCYLEMFQAMNDGDLQTARERAEALQAWLQKGGFYPPNYSQTEVDGYLANVLRRTAHLSTDPVPKFSLGQTVATPAALETIARSEILAALGRHSQGDWGDLDEHDHQENKLALEQGARLLSVYYTQDGTKFWVITEADRSVTTVLLPEDY